MRWKALHHFLLLNCIISNYFTSSLNVFIKKNLLQNRWPSILKKNPNSVFCEVMSNEKFANIYNRFSCGFSDVWEICIEGQSTFLRFSLFQEIRCETTLLIFPIILFFCLCYLLLLKIAKIIEIPFTVKYLMSPLTH